MQEIQKMCKNILNSLLIILIGLLIISLFSYLGILKGNILSISKLIVIFVAVLVGSYRHGKYSSKKGVIEILKIGIVFPVLFLILNSIFYRTFAPKNLFYYALMLFTSIVGSMFGVSKRKNS